MITLQIKYKIEYFFYKFSNIVFTLNIDLGLAKFFIL